MVVESPELTESDDPRPQQRSMVAGLLVRLRAVHAAAWLTLALAAVFALVFGRLGVEHHRNFGTWAFDMGIYDQGFWLVSQRGGGFVTVRGMEFWGHHVNLIAVAFVPFYWLGAGPSFLYVAQATVLAAGALPVYLIARDRFTNPWMGMVFGIVYLMYAPVQWIAWANFHPEALVITPLLFGWWFAVSGRWTPAFVALVIALSTREDAALAVFVMGGVLWWTFRRARLDRRHQHRAIAVGLLGAGWYLLATRLVMPAFNDWQQPFYVEYFFGHYGSTMPEIATEMIARPDRVVSDATQPDRLRFYRDLLLPVGGLPLASPLHLLMAVPQILASVLGTSPYARTIRFQYTSVMVGPILIASIEGAWRLWRYQLVQRFLVPWLFVCAYITNVAWSPSPISANSAVWARAEPRHETLREALTLVPSDVSVAATFAFVPHLSQRDEIFDWPNPWVASYWGNDDDHRLPHPSTIDYVVLDLRHVGSAQQDLLEDLVGPDGEFDVLLRRDEVVVARRPVASPAP